MSRTPVPTEFQPDEQTVASPRSVKYAQDLLLKKDLFSNTQWFDRYNAMCSTEYRAMLDRTAADMATWDQKKISKTIDWLKDMPWLPRESDSPSNSETQLSFRRDLPTPEVLPAGRYAIESDDGELRFYRLWRGTRNPMYIKLYVQHGPDQSEVPFRSAVSIVQKIVAAGPRECAIRYGHEIGSCCICGIRLTNTLSRELGIGPVCGGRFYGDEDEWKLVKKEARETIVARGEDPDAEAV